MAGEDETVLSGLLADQGVLYGLLTRLRDIGQHWFRWRMRKKTAGSGDVRQDSEHLTPCRFTSMQDA